MYESEPLEEAIDEWVDFGRVRRSPAELIVVAVDEALAARSPLRCHPAFVRMRHHRHVDRLTVIRASQPDALQGPADFAPQSIARRMALGYADARVALDAPAPGRARSRRT